MVDVALWPRSGTRHELSVTEETAAIIADIRAEIEILQRGTERLDTNVDRLEDAVPPPNGEAEQ